MSLVICVVSLGREKGKTSLIEQLTERFTEEGLQVATVKHIHGSFDTREKDTWRHLEAGAIMAVAATSREVVSLKRIVNPSLEEALEAVYVNPHLVLVEGYKESSAPKILCADTVSDVETAMKVISNVIMVSGPIADDAGETEKLKTQLPETGVYRFEELVSALKEKIAFEVLKRLPGLNCGHCDYTSCLKLSKAILLGKATLDDCEALTTRIVVLKIDDRVVPLSKFPQDILRGTIMGMLGSLKDVENHPKNIEIRIRV